MELRKVFDTIPEQFDRYRPRYTPALFADLIEYAALSPKKTVLELGPGTGQATEPILQTGCDYHAIELGEHLYETMCRNFGARDNFHIVCDDFITHDFGTQKFDLIYSAATIQWIPEEIAYPKVFGLLNPGGVLAMMLTLGDYRTPNEVLYQEIQKVYSAYFRPETEYHQRFGYTNAPKYGFASVERLEYPGTRILTADEYVALSGTHCDHLVIPEPYRTPFFTGLRNAVLAAGDRIEFKDTHILYLTRKPYC